MLNGLGDFYFMVGAGCVLLMWFALGGMVILMMSKQHDWEVNYKLDNKRKLKYNRDK